MSFRIAQKTALKSPFLKHRVGAVVMKGKRILSSGFNEIRYDKTTQRGTMHAEAAAIGKLLNSGAQAELVGSTIFVTRYTRSGLISCAKPCDECYELIRSVGIRKVVYTDFDGSTKRMKV